MRSEEASIVAAAVIAAAFASCGGPAVAAPRFAIEAHVRFATDPDGEHVTFPTQNGSVVSITVNDLVGKTVLWGTVPGGDSINNATQVDKGFTTMGADLTSTWITPAHYAPGPWELACIVSVSGVPKPYTPGDLGARDESPPPPGEPPLTGASVRVHVIDGDATITLTNADFRRFEGPR